MEFLTYGTIARARCTKELMVVTLHGLDLSR